jgi:hypothetical protein
MMEDPDLYSSSEEQGARLPWWCYLILLGFLVAIVALSPKKNPEKIDLELFINDTKRVISIDKGKIVSIHVYPESGTYKVTYTSDNIEETL